MFQIGNIFRAIINCKDFFKKISQRYKRRRLFKKIKEKFAGILEEGHFLVVIVKGKELRKHSIKPMNISERCGLDFYLNKQCIGAKSYTHSKIVVLVKMNNNVIIIIYNDEPIIVKGGKINEHYAASQSLQ